VVPCEGYGQVMRVKIDHEDYLTICEFGVGIAGVSNAAPEKINQVENYEGRRTAEEPVPAESEPRRTAEEPEPAESEPQPYKAMVLLYLAGGADTFSMVVPQKCALYDEYVTVRKHLALRPDELQEIQTVGQACTKFGIHHGMPFLKELYDQDNAAFVSNIGSLVKPSTREQFRRGTVNQCKGMFSHSDQTKAAHVMDCRPVVGSSHGVAGRIGDEIGTQYTTSSFSMAGQSTWSQGGSTYPSIVGPFGVQRFKEYNRLKSVVANITMQQHGNVMSDEFARQFGQVIKTSEFLGSVFQNTRLSTDCKVENGLDNQLRQVATLIAARKVRKAERDFFLRKPLWMGYPSRGRLGSQAWTD